LDAATLTDQSRLLLRQVPLSTPSSLEGDVFTIPYYFPVVLDMDIYIRIYAFTLGRALQIGGGHGVELERKKLE
jgi:hypothetical protein